MQAQPHSQDRSGAEILLDRLATTLNRHALWDALLLIVPPFGAAIYTFAVLFHPAWMNLLAIMVVLITAAAAATLGGPAIRCQRSFSHIGDAPIRQLSRLVHLKTTPRKHRLQ